MIDKLYLTTEEAANYLSLKPATLTQWRAAGKGPNFIKAGKRIVRYTKEDLDNWIKGRKDV